MVPTTTRYDGLTGLFEIVRSVMLLALLVPVGLLMAALVRLRRLTCRTMHVNADPSLQHAFIGRDPETVARVANTIAALYIDEQA